MNQQSQVKVVEVERPELKPNHVLVQTRYSMVSPGTEMTAIRSNRDTPSNLGYSASGIAVEVGDNVNHIKPGQRVACYGAPYVNHSEYLLVPKHLVSAVPESVDLRESASAGLGAIAIHAHRQAGLMFGEFAVIIGLGVIGQLIARIAQASAMKVLAVDLFEERREALAEVEGITICSSMEEVQEMVARISGGIGADAVFHCASGRQKELLDASFDWLRDRGKIVIVGDMTMDYTRSQMFRKEANVIISRAGGPGRYDPQYESECQDYPVGYVRWTEGRNIEEYIRLLSEKRIGISSLITREVPVEQVASIYEEYMTSPRNILGAVIAYE